MGACASSGAYDEQSKDLQLAHKRAEKEMREARSQLNAQSKVLLLGSGDSGKSTVLKQMRLIHHQPFTPEETESYRHLVFHNLTHGLQSVLEAADALELALSSEKDAQAIEDAPDIKDGEPFPMEYKGILERMWRDESVQLAIKRGSEFALPENMPYFFNDLDRLFAPNYSPTEEDIVRARARTIGLTETSFKLGHRTLLVVDVGGQRSERRKWIHCFQDVTAIIFLVSLSGYDQCLAEDKDANQMQDAMTIWDTVTGNPFFKHTAFMLFLNKMDLFEAKVKNVSIRTTFPDFDGPEGDAIAGSKYFQNRFVRLAQRTGSRDRGLYPYTTTATNRQLLSAVMKVVEDIILRRNLEDATIL